LPGGLHAHQPGLAQDAQVLGHAGLRDAEKLNQVVHRARALRDGLDDTGAGGFGEGSQGIHCWLYNHLGMFKSTACLRGKMVRMTEAPRHIVFELQELGIEIMRSNLRRRHPEATEAEVEALLSAWLRERPAAPQGDAEGVSSDRFS
jgi:hypothetical protein